MRTFLYFIRHPILALKEFLHGFLYPDDYSKEAESEEEKIQLLRFAIGLYKQTLGQLPKELKDLCFNNQDHKDWDGEFINWRGDDTFVDSFGLPYDYKSDGETYSLISIGLTELRHEQAEQDGAG